MNAEPRFRGLVTSVVFVVAVLSTAAGGFAASTPHNGDLPTWSPDGRAIGFVVPSRKSPGNSQTDIDHDFRAMVMAPSGSGRRVVARVDPTEYAQELRWADDSHMIVSFGSAGELINVDVQTGKKIELGASNFSPLSLAANETFVVSANGRQVACTTDSPYQDANLTPERRRPDNDFAIATMSSSGGRSRVLPQPVHASDAWPSFSPDGKQVVFARSLLSHGAPTGAPSLMVQSVNGRDARSLNILGDHPVWSPNARWIVYQHLVPGATKGYLVPWTLDIVSPNGGKPRTLLNSNVDEALSLAWSPDSTRVAFITESGRMGTTTLTGKVTIFGLPGLSLDGGVLDTSPSWSPDGKTLLFAARPNANPVETDIYTIDANGHGLHRIG